jgi:hypothetical protein
MPGFFAFGATSACMLPLVNCPTEVQPVRPAQVQIVRPVQTALPVPPQQHQRSIQAGRRERDERQTARQPQASGGVAALLGVWQTNIPGVA